VGDARRSRFSAKDGPALKLRAAALFALSALAALVVACGGSAADGGADPASAVPADAMVYSEVVIQPSGGVRDDALAAAGKVLRTDDPSGKLRELVDKALAQDGSALDWDKDIKPWLGDRAGVWFSSRLDSEGDPGGSALIATTDPDAALDAFHKASSAEKLTSRTYHDASYEVDKDGVATGIVDDFLATGPEADFKRTVDAAAGDSLADSDRYRKAVDGLDDSRLAHFYVDLKRVIDLARRQQPENTPLDGLESALPFANLPPVVGTFAANGDRLTVDVSTEGFDSRAFGSFGGFAGTTPLIKDLPGDSWAAFGAADYGKQLAAVLGSYAGLFGGAAARQQLQQQYGIDLDRDILSWIGDVAFFVRGDSVATLGGGAVIEVTDSGKAAKGFGKIAGLLQSAGGVRVDPVTIKGAKTAFAITERSTPQPIVMALSDERVVMAYGRDAAEQALAPSSKLGDASLYDQASSALDGIDPGLLVSMPAVLKLVDASGSADADFQRARPYLDVYDAVALGYDDKRVRFAAGLK
jgi:Protein of unknown function (DUF3352)